MPQAKQFLLAWLVHWHSEFIVECTQRSHVYVGYYHYHHSYLKVTMVTAFLVFVLPLFPSHKLLHLSYVAIHCRILKNKNMGWPPMFIICSVYSCRHPDRYDQPRMCSFLACCAKHAQQVTQNNLVPNLMTIITRYVTYSVMLKKSYELYSWLIIKLMLYPYLCKCQPPE
jgi:hypothetical protein